MVKLKEINLTKDKVSIHPALISKYQAFNTYESEFEIDAFTKEFFCNVVKVNYLQVIEAEKGEYLCIAGYEWLEKIYQHKIQRITVILHEEINIDEIETINATGLLLSHCLMKEHHIFLASLAELINKIPKPIRRKLLGENYSYSGMKTIENITNKTRSAIENQKEVLIKKQLNNVSPNINILDMLIRRDN